MQYLPITCYTYLVPYNICGTTEFKGLRLRNEGNVFAMNNPIWKKQKGTDLLTLWDSESSWCLIMGVAAYGMTPCRLSHYPPQESAPLISQTFDVVTDDEPTVKSVLEQIAEAAETCHRASMALSLLDGSVVTDRELHDLRRSG